MFNPCSKFHSWLQTVGNNHKPSSANASHITQGGKKGKHFHLSDVISSLWYQMLSPTCNYETRYFLQLVFSSRPCSVCRSLIFPQVCELCEGVGTLARYQHTWGSHMFVEDAFTLVVNMIEACEGSGRGGCTRPVSWGVWQMKFNITSCVH